MKTASLRLAPASLLVGRLIDAKIIRAEILPGCSIEWILANVPGKRKYGHRTVLWIEHEVRQWALERGK